MTCTVVAAVLPRLGWQEYRPESDTAECCTSRNEEVVLPE